MPSPRVIAALVALDLASLALRAQGGPGSPQQPPRFRTGIDVIQLDLRARDRRVGPSRRSGGRRHERRAILEGGLGRLPFNLPLAILAPGPHLLTMEASADGTSLRRDVRFIKRARTF